MVTSVMRPYASTVSLRPTSFRVFLLRLLRILLADTVKNTTDAKALPAVGDDKVPTMTVTLSAQDWSFLEKREETASKGHIKSETPRKSSAPVRQLDHWDTNQATFTLAMLDHGADATINIEYSQVGWATFATPNNKEKSFGLDGVLGPIRPKQESGIEAEESNEHVLHWCYPPPEVQSAFDLT